MSYFQAAKVLGGLPAQLTKSTMYCVKVGPGFDLYITDDNVNPVAVKLNELPIPEVEGAIDDWFAQSNLDDRLNALEYGILNSIKDTDPRLDDAREWTADTVTAEEAAEGLSDVPRKWTAQRVRQAVLEWWNSSADKAKLYSITAGTGGDMNQKTAKLLALGIHPLMDDA